MNRRWTYGGAIAVVLLLITVWAWGGTDSKDPAVRELEKLRDEDFARQEQMTEAERQASREQFGERMRGLSEEQRRSFFESSAPIFMKMFEARVDQFLKLSPEEQDAEIDKRIDEMQARRQAGPPQAGGPGGGAAPSAQQIDEMRKKMLDWTTPEQRAKFDTAFQKFNERLKQRGMSSMPGGGFF